MKLLHISSMIQDTTQATAEVMMEKAAPVAVEATTNAVDMGLFTTNNLWILVATALVFIMHLGFASLEAGFTQSKNTVNILFKNTMVPAIGLISYALVGFNLMYPGEDFAGGFFGFAGFGLESPADSATGGYNESYTYWSDFMFQGMFAATAVTIVSGAVAERIKLGSFLIFAVFYVSLIYPIGGMWKWGGGFLDALGFYDFAGSTLVHALGGWGAFVGASLLGARINKFNGEAHSIPGHNMPLATIGVFLLWLGWFGFNGGSVLSADPQAVSLVFATTSIAAAAGAIGAFFTSYFVFKSHDLSMVLNGVLAGLVSITAGADQMGITDSIIIGLIGGALVVFSVLFFDKIRVDDPVGAISVHLVCGMWGTLAVGIFGAMAGGEQFLNQLIGTLSIGALATVGSFIIFFIIKKTLGLRVSEEHEKTGLDISEHSMTAYNRNLT